MNLNDNDDTVSIGSSVAYSNINYFAEQILSESAEARYNIDLERPEDRYLERCVKNIVDDVCLFYGKIDIIKRQQEKANDAEKETLNTLLKTLSIKGVPLTLEADSMAFRNLIKPQIENELGKEAGYFGWCIMCRSSANLYCKETRVPVCSIDCKLQHYQELRNASFKA